MSTPKPWYLALPVCLLLSGCWQASEIRPHGLNPVLRPDRAAPDAQQRRLETEPELAAGGPWRVRSSDVVDPITPVDDLAANLPQSDCWFPAQDAAGGGDPVRGHWEGVWELPDLAAEGYADPDDGTLDLATCRFDDPQTREPVRLDGVAQQVQCKEVLVGPPNPVVFMPSGLFPGQCEREMVRLHWLRIDARRLVGGGGRWSRCEIARGSAQKVEPILPGVDGYAGGAIEGYLPSCSPPEGELLQPAQPTRYAIDAGLGFVEHGPYLVPLREGALVARPLTAGAGAWRWQAASERLAGGARWEENFSSRLRVAAVEVFELPAASDPENPATVPAAPAASRASLCIDEDASGACRWRCEATRIGNGHLRAALDSGAVCRDAQGAVATPQLTPTYALDRAAAGLLDEPLRWRVDLPGGRQPWIGFQLAVVGATAGRGAALRAEPGAIDLAPVQQGAGTSGRGWLRNVGVHPLRIEQLGVAAQSRHGADFRVVALGAREPLPLAIDLRYEKHWTLQVDPAVDALLQASGGSWHRRLRRVDVPPPGLRLQPFGDAWLRDAGSAPTTAAPLAPTRPANPFALSSWRQRTLPFVLRPGEQVELQVVATPGGLGVREALVEARWRSTLDAQAQGTVQQRWRVVGQSGPFLVGMPGRLSLHASAEGVGVERSLLVANEGDRTTQLGTPRLLAAGGGPLPSGTRLGLSLPEGGTGALLPGASRLLRVQAVGRCGRPLQAELHWPHSTGTVLVPVTVSTACGAGR